MFDPHSPFSAAKPARTAPERASKLVFATERLRDAILSCDLAPGAKVNEQDLADRFGLGRAATRGALAQLAGRGLVQAIPRSGWRIAPLSPRRIGALIDARRQLEPALAAARPKDPELDEMRRLSDVAQSLRGQHDKAARETARAHDRALLDLLAAASNRWIAAWLAQAWDESARALCFLERASAKDAPLPDRGPLLAALTRGDVEGARGAILTALDSFARYLAEAAVALDVEITLDAPVASAGGAGARSAGDKRKREGPAAAPPRAPVGGPRRSDRRGTDNDQSKQTPIPGRHDRGGFTGGDGPGD